jgi:hypothetical protein
VLEQPDCCTSLRPGSSGDCTPRAEHQHGR